MRTFSMGVFSFLPPDSQIIIKESIPVSPARRQHGKRHEEDCDSFHSIAFASQGAKGKSASNRARYKPS